MIAVDGIPDFWERVRSAERRALFLDYDGTLAPFTEDRHQAYPLDGVADLLEMLERAPRTEIAVVSGRPVADILRFLDHTSIPVAGTHGFEFHDPEKALQVWDLDEGDRRALDAAEQVSREIIGDERTERKVATVALHVRGLPTDRAQKAAREFEQRVKDLATNSRFEIRPFDGGIEFRATGRDKGTVVRDLIVHLSDVDLIVYIGDDDTDEDAFRALPANGLGIKVGRPDNSSAAHGRLSTCEDVRQLLWNWTQIEDDVPTNQADR